MLSIVDAIMDELWMCHVPGANIILNKCLLWLLHKLSKTVPVFQKFTVLLERGDMDKDNSSEAIQALHEHSYIMSLAQRRGSINSGWMKTLHRWKVMSQSCAGEYQRIGECGRWEKPLQKSWALIWVLFYPFVVCVPFRLRESSVSGCSRLYGSATRSVLLPRHRPYLAWTLA